MWGKALKLRPEILQKVERAAKRLGCASREEFIEHVLEREADRVLGSASPEAGADPEAEDIAKKLKGLGYLE
jgi:hypothetical protein